MVIKADKEGHEVIIMLCDIALKMNGIKNFDGVNNILKSIELIEGGDNERDNNIPV